MKYCCLHQKSNQKTYFLNYDERGIHNISDDEKRRKHFGKLAENDHENESSCGKHFQAKFLCCVES